MFWKFWNMETIEKQFQWIALMVLCSGQKTMKSNKTKKRKIMFLEHLFQEELWECEQSKRCLVGRLVLLNKDHPKTPELGKFRPIRICSNVVKFLQASLYSKLAKWGEANLRQQFGFVKAISCENLRTFVFRQMRSDTNRSLISIQYSQLVDTQKFDKEKDSGTLKKFNFGSFQILIQKLGFKVRKRQISTVFLKDHDHFYHHYFLIYINDLFVGLRVLGYADDLIAITPDKKQMSKFILETKRFCNKRMLTVNEKKSDVLLFGYPSIKNFQAKYLGVSYERDLSIEKANREFLPKIRWISSRLWKLLRDSDFRTRFNLWQVFIARSTEWRSRSQESQILTLHKCKTKNIVSVSGNH